MYDAIAEEAEGRVRDLLQGAGYNTDAIFGPVQVPGGGIATDLPGYIPLLGRLIQIFMLETIQLQLLPSRIGNDNTAIAARLLFKTLKEDAMHLLDMILKQYIKLPKGAPEKALLRPNTIRRTNSNAGS